MKIVRLILVAALMGAHLTAHATSFDCNRGRSLTEKMICDDPALSRLDDTLGQLYWKARRRVTKRRAFLIDSDSKWAWREANCRDAACLGTWYGTRIAELQRLLETMQQGAPARRGEEEAPLSEQGFETAALQCTARDPGIVVHDQCATVIRHASQWGGQPRGADWFCGIAMVEGPPGDGAQ